MGLISKIEGNQSEPTSYEVRIAKDDSCARFSILSDSPVLITQKETESNQASPQLSIIRKYVATRHRALRTPGSECVITITPTQKKKPTLIVFGKASDGMPSSIESDSLNKKLDSDLEHLRKIASQPATQPAG